MIITYRYGDVDERWDFKPQRDLMEVEAEAIEKVTGLPFNDWGQRVMQGPGAARRALIWVLRKRTDPTLRFRDVNYPVGAVAVDFDEEERAGIRQAILADPSLTDEQREQLLPQFAADVEPEAGADPDPTAAAAS